MKIMYIGTGGSLSIEPLKGIINAGFDVCAIAGGNTRSSHKTFAGIPLIGAFNESTVSLADANHITFIPLGSDRAKNIHEVSICRPDLIIVSCYGKRLAAEIIAIPRLGCYNIHPSLLPAYRGPDPLFWQLRAGEKMMGVSIHRVTEVFDSGDLLIQGPLDLSDGLSLEQANKCFANLAKDLLLEVLADFEAYQRCETAQVNNQSKMNLCEILGNKVWGNEIQPSYQSFAQRQDFDVSVSWTAQRMFNFISAYWEAGRCFSCTIKNEVFQLGKALSFEPSGKLTVPYDIDNFKITLACASGFIQCQLVCDHL